MCFDVEEMDANPLEPISFWSDLIADGTCSYDWIWDLGALEEEPFWPLLFAKMLLKTLQ